MAAGCVTQAKAPRSEPLTANEALPAKQSLQFEQVPAGQWYLRTTQTSPAGETKTTEKPLHIVYTTRVRASVMEKFRSRVEQLTRDIDSPANFDFISRKGRLLATAKAEPSKSGSGSIAILSEKLSGSSLDAFLKNAEGRAIMVQTPEQLDKALARAKRANPGLGKIYAPPEMRIGIEDAELLKSGLLQGLKSDAGEAKSIISTSKKNGIKDAEKATTQMELSEFEEWWRSESLPHSHRSASNQLKIPLTPHHERSESSMAILQPISHAEGDGIQADKHEIEAATPAEGASLHRHTTQVIQSHDPLFEKLAAEIIQAVNEPVLAGNEPSKAAADAYNALLLLDGDTARRIETEQLLMRAKAQSVTDQSESERHESADSHRTVDSSITGSALFQSRNRAA
ncbi:MAG: hypothetical protein J5J00_00095 [Deltaproteobacteria bacterium]|nr:hypothetical protein [Deltaproteobacteria bacterium]